jgi:hypothetical protein
VKISPDKPARKVASPCRHCGREFFRGKRDGRRRLFCSNACRQAEFRNAEFGRRYQVPDPLRNAENNRANSVACKGENQGRGSIISRDGWPTNLLGGSRHGTQGRLDSELRARIIEIEVGKGRA